MKSEAKYWSWAIMRSVRIAAKRTHQHRHEVLVWTALAVVMLGFALWFLWRVQVI